MGAPDGADRSVLTWYYIKKLLPLIIFVNICFSRYHTKQAEIEKKFEVINLIMRNASLNIHKLFSISPCSVRRGSFCFLYIYSKHLNTCVNNLKKNKNAPWIVKYINNDIDTWYRYLNPIPIPTLIPDTATWSQLLIPDSDTVGRQHVAHHNHVNS